MLTIIDNYGVDYDIIRPRKPRAPRPRYGLMDAYIKPSREKIKAYEWWTNYGATSGNYKNFGIVSHNTFSFTLEGDYVDDDGKVIGLIVITHRNHRIYLY